MPDPTTGLIAGGTILGTTLIGGHYIGEAADEQADAALAAALAELEMYYQSRKDLAPWRKAGEWALSGLKDLITAGPGEFTESPGYKFRLSEGEKAIDRALTSRGKYFSGQAGKALAEYGQDYATNEYDNFLRRYHEKMAPYQSLAGLGQTTASQTANLANIAGEAKASGILGAGHARGTGYINLANLYSDTANQVMTPLMLWQMGAFQN